MPTLSWNLLVTYGERCLGLGPVPHPRAPDKSVYGSHSPLKVCVSYLFLRPLVPA